MLRRALVRPEAFAAIGVLLVGACARPPEKPPALELASDSQTEVSVTGRSGVVTLFGTPEILVRRPAEIVDVQMGEIDGELELLDVRLSFRSCAPCPRPPGRPRVNGLVAAICTHTWPPKGFGPAVPAEGAEVHAGERTSVVVYLRTPRLGENVFHGLTVRYRNAGERRIRTLRVPSPTGLVRVVDDVRYRELVRGQRPRCDDDPMSVWLGHDVDDGYRVEPAPS